MYTNHMLSMIIDSTLPAQVDHFHSLVPLDITNQKSAAFFEYPSWVYKVTSSKDGYTYVLRRLEGTFPYLQLDII